MGCNTIYPDCDMNRWESQCSSLIVDADNYYTKSEIDSMIESGVTVDAYTKEETNELLNEKLDASAYTPTDLSEYWTSAQTDSAIEEATSGKVDNSTFESYTSSTATEIGDKLAVSDFNTYSGAVDTAINSKASQANVDALNDVLSAHTANTVIHVTSTDKETWNAKSDFSGSYNDLTDKPTIPTVPTSNTAFTNDAGYLTEHQSLSAYSTTEEVNTAIAEATSGKTNNSDFSAHTADTSIHLTSGDVQTQIDNSISGKADTTAIYNYVSGDRINVKTAPGVRTKSINLNLPIYSGNGSSSVSVNITSSVSGNGDNHIAGSGSFGAGYMIETKHRHEAAFGVYNVSNGQTQEQFVHSSGNTLFSVGNGKPQNTGGSLRRHNAFEIRQNGDIYIADTNDATIDEPQRKPMIKLQDKLSSIDATIGDINTILESI